MPLQPVRRRSSLVARRSDAGWSPGSFSPAIFIVALAVILLLVGVAAASRRGETGPAPTATTAAAPAPAGVPAVTATQATGRVFVVGNTGGDGVYLRRTPRSSDRDRAYPDGTRLEQIGEDVRAEGTTWRNVRAPDGRTGWVPAQYTLESR